MITLVMNLHRRWARKLGKTLYITDLDGTLLNTKGAVSAQSALKINKLIDEGAAFSIATARTPGTVVGLLECLNIKIPVVLMNGVVIYDLQQKKYLNVAYIDEKVVKKIYEILGYAVKKAFVYTIKEDCLTAYYDTDFNSYQEEFYGERKNSSYKKFVRATVEDLSHVAYLFFMDTKANIEAIYNQLVDIEGLAMTMYEDIYTKAYLLEVYSHKATKANGVKKVAELGEYNEVVCFGDNLNDLSMFKIAHRGVAVNNAAPALKEVAYEIIGTNEEDAVASYVEKDFFDKGDK